MSDTPASLRGEIGSAADIQCVACRLKTLAASNIGYDESSVPAQDDEWRCKLTALRWPAKDSHGKRHRMRQSGIDAKLFDVIPGYEALSDRV